MVMLCAMAPRRLYVASLLFFLARACTDTADDSTCLASQKKAQTVEFSNYAPQIDEFVEEGVDEPDLIMHMQMRLAVDLPADVAHADAFHDKDPFQAPAEPRKLSQPPPSVTQQGSEVTRTKVPLAMLGQSSDAHSLQDHPTLTLFQMWVHSLPFLQIVTVVGILLVCLVIWQVVRVAEKTVLRKRSAKDIQFDPSARLQQLLRTLRFEPQGDPGPQLLPNKQETQIMCEDDSGNKSEEEPEEEAPVESAVEAVANGAEKSAGRTDEARQQLVTEAEHVC